jgi:hypothetical protein
LDVGARDGYFSFAAESRGAEVLAIDAVALEHLKGFQIASTLLNSSVEMACGGRDAAKQSLRVPVL